MEKFLFILSLIFTPCTVILICLKVYYHINYKGSLEESLDKLSGKKATYTGGLEILLVILLVGISYIIYYSTK